MLKWFKSLSEISTEQKMHDDLLCGERGIEELSNADVLLLYRFNRWYHPSFEVFSMCDDELKRRREKRKIQKTK